MPPSQREMSPQAAAVRIPTRSGTLEIFDQRRRHARARGLPETVAPSAARHRARTALIDRSG
jgi:hypothetical protein